MLLLDADASPVANTIALSSAAPEYAPPGRVLVSTSMVHGAVPARRRRPEVRAAPWPGCTAPTPRLGARSRPTTCRARCRGCRAPHPMRRPVRLAAAGRRCTSPATTATPARSRARSSPDAAPPRRPRRPRSPPMTHGCWPTPSTPCSTGPCCPATPSSATGCGGRPGRPTTPARRAARQDRGRHRGQLRARHSRPPSRWPGSVPRCTWSSATWPRAVTRSTEIRGEVPGAELLLHRCDVSDLDDVRALRGRPARVRRAASTCSCTTPGRCRPTGTESAAGPRDDDGRCTCSARC